MIISPSLAAVAAPLAHPDASHRQTASHLLNPLVWKALPLLDWNKVGVKGCSAKHPALDANRREGGGQCFVTPPPIRSPENA